MAPIRHGHSAPRNVIVKAEAEEVSLRSNFDLNLCRYLCFTVPPLTDSPRSANSNMTVGDTDCKLESTAPLVDRRTNVRSTRPKVIGQDSTDPALASASAQPSPFPCTSHTPIKSFEVAGSDPIFGEDPDVKPPVRHSSNASIAARLRTIYKADLNHRFPDLPSRKAWAELNGTTPLYVYTCFSRFRKEAEKLGLHVADKSSAQYDLLAAERDLLHQAANFSTGHVTQELSDTPCLSSTLSSSPCSSLPRTPRASSPALIDTETNNNKRAMRTTDHIISPEGHSSDEPCESFFCTTCNLDFYYSSNQSSTQSLDHSSKDNNTLHPSSDTLYAQQPSEFTSHQCPTPLVEVNENAHKCDVSRCQSPRRKRTVRAFLAARRRRNPDDATFWYGRFSQRSIFKRMSLQVTKRLAPHLPNDANDPNVDETCGGVFGCVLCNGLGTCGDWSSIGVLL